MHNQADLLGFVGFFDSLSLTYLLTYAFSKALA